MNLRDASRLVLGFSMLLGLAAPAHAQATRTWVSGVGDDVNPCSRTAPCKTFAGAISKTANGGFINVLDSGGFGAVTITKSITIDGEGAHAGILAAGVTGITINGSNIRVTLRNLSIESPQPAPAAPPPTPGIIGVRVLQAAEVHIEKCWIGGFSSHGVDFAPSGGGELHMSDTTSSNNSGAGVRVGTGRATISGLRAESNGTGVLVNGAAIATVRGSHASSNSAGFSAEVSAAAVLNVHDSVTTQNTHGVVAESGATVRVSNTLIVSNSSFGLLNSGGTSFLVSLGGNSVIGNATDGAFTSTVAKQ